MWLRLVLSGAAVLAVANSSAFASVTLESSMTGVSVETRTGRAAVPVGSQVDRGARVHVANAVGGNGGETTLRFDNGCEVKLRPGQVYTVPAEPPCAPVSGAEGAAAASLGGVAPAVVGAGLVAVGVGAAVAVSARSKSSAPLPYISR